MVDTGGAQRHPGATERLMERFLSKVQITASGCWQWTAATNRDGYGQFGLDRRWVLAHRFSYLRHVGTIPEEFDVDHLCRNRGCVNPAHLEAVPERVNVLRSDAPAAINARKTHCIRGHALAGENLRIRSCGRRQCITCHRDASRRQRSAA